MSIIKFNLTPKHQINFDLSALCAGQTVAMMNVKVCLMITSLLVLVFKDDPSYATLPIVFMIIGTLLGTTICPVICMIWTRINTHRLSLVIAIIGCLLASLSIIKENILILLLGCFLIGFYSGFARYYSFDAADLVPMKHKSKAISYIIFAGVPSAILGPLLAEKTHFTIHQYPFLTTFLALALLNLIIILFFLPAKLSTVQISKPPPHLKKITWLVNVKNLITKKSFVVGTIATSISFLIMTQIMVATPIAMHAIYHYNLAAITLAMQLHYLGMFAPALLANQLIQYLGLRKIMLLGIIIYFICIWVITSGTSQMHFYISLFLLGVGWNFIYLVGTTIIAKCYHMKDRNLVQGANNFITYFCSVIAALLAGPLLFHLGWIKLNYLTLPFCILLLLTAFIIHQD